MMGWKMGKMSTVNVPQKGIKQARPFFSEQRKSDENICDSNRGLK